MRKFQQMGQSKWKNVFFVLVLQLCTMIALAQVRISGKVTGADGKGIPVISVSVRNTTYGGATDADGMYAIQANLRPGSYTLDFSGVGFKSKSQSLQVGNASSYTSDVELAIDALNMDEVILTGVSLGTTRKQLGNYISTVKADELTKGATSNVLSALQGKTAGAQIIQNNGDPAGGFSVRLRGISSILSSSEPLYIVDGVIVNNATNRVTNTENSYDGTNFVGTIGQNRLADINPADIDHIEVLNGAAAAAIYGSRANAGVVQIFTKRGANGAPVVNFSTGIMMNQLRKKIGVNMAPTKFGGPTDGPGALTQDLITTVGGVLPTNTTPVTRYDYQDYIFDTGLGTDNNVSVSGGTDKTKYYISGSYFYNQGIVKNTDAQRYSFRANIDQTLNQWLSVSLGLNYVNSSSMRSRTAIHSFHQ